MDYIDANKYYLKQICVVNKVDQKEMKKYAGIIWKCNDAVKPFHRGSIEVSAYRDQRMIALQYLQYDRHDLGMVERSASYLAMTNDLKSMVRDTVYKVQDVFGTAADRYMAIYEKFFGFMGGGRTSSGFTERLQRSSTLQDQIRGTDCIRYCF